MIFKDDILYIVKIWWKSLILLWMLMHESTPNYLLFLFFRTLHQCPTLMVTHPAQSHWWQLNPRWLRFSMADQRKSPSKRIRMQCYHCWCRNLFCISWFMLTYFLCLIGMWRKLLKMPTHQKIQWSCWSSAAGKIPCFPPLSCQNFYGRLPTHTPMSCDHTLTYFSICCSWKTHGRTIEFIMHSKVGITAADVGVW